MDGKTSMDGMTSGPITTMPVTRKFEDNTDFPSLQNLESALMLANQNMSRLIQAILEQFPAESAESSRLAVANSTSGGTTVKVGPGHLMSISVNIPSTGPTGTVYDANSPANVGSTNIMTLIPNTGLIDYGAGFPFTNGLTIQPSTNSGQTVSVFFV